MPHEKAIKARAEARAEELLPVYAEAQGMAHVLLKMLARKGIELSPEQRQMIEACYDPAQVDIWIDRAFDAKSAADVFG